MATIELLSIFLKPILLPLLLFLFFLFSFFFFFPFCDKPLFLGLLGQKLISEMNGKSAVRGGVDGVGLAVLFVSL